MWTALVVGTLVGGFFLVRRVFRSATALATALGELAEAIDRLDAQVRVLEETIGTEPAPVDLEDPAPARARLHDARQARLARRRCTVERHEAAYRRWWSFVH